ncbi:hypothetical protein [Pseudozobellia thermophila]|uniref:Carboxypeptidase regulatory-like domain-containing protein n=1 Tax=Pseudozobellia thermophila TaxID=192903 RepID=A0A1M6L9L3_9FLAO|nr:hypothetical protein [Pseudozobellia thermophila]SHJ67855.1 hypothetical protein SAMN04488513_10775 [Pseudozobellia thermophila]
MGYIIRGNLSASLFPDIRESVSNVEVLIYLKNGQNRSKGKLKSKLRPLSRKEIAKRENLVIGKAQTDAKGNYEVELNALYQDEPITIDVRLSKVPCQKTTRHKPLQFNLACLKPIWHRRGHDYTYSYSYNFSFENWYRIRRVFDAWTICGVVKYKGREEAGLSGLVVTAMDVDWVQDDLIGRGTTDDRGCFRVDYDSSDFKKTFLSPLVNIETPITAIPGPGLYFRVESADGTVLYEEDRSIGHTSGRKNVAHCFFVELSLQYASHKVVEP